MTETPEIRQFNHELDALLGISENSTSQDPSPVLLAGSEAGNGESNQVQPEPASAEASLLELSRAIGELDWPEEMHPSASLQARWLQGTQQAQHRLHRRRTARWIWASVGLVLLLAFLLAGPSNVLASLRGLLGYIPGVGLVRLPASLRVLAEPVELVREGITLRVESAVLDERLTRLEYSVEGLNLSVANAGGEAGPHCSGSPRLHLPDGTRLASQAGEGSGWGSGYQRSFIFPAIPPDVNQALFMLDCIDDMPPGSAPEDWQLELQFMSAPSDLTVMPVTELGTNDPQAAVLEESMTPASLASSPGSENHAESANGTGTPAAANTSATQGATEHNMTAGLSLRLLLDKIVTLDDGYILSGNLEDTDPRFDAYSGFVQIVDASGEELPVESVSLMDLGEANPAPTQWAARLQGLFFDPPLSVGVTDVDISLVEPVSFSFDPGSDLKPGLELPVNEKFDILGLPVELLSARYLVLGDMQGFEFTARLDPALTRIDMGFESGAVNARGSGSGGGLRDDSGLVKLEVMTDGELVGPYEIGVRMATLAGPFQVSWTPPLASPGLTPTPKPVACLTLAGWKALAGQSAQLPEGLNGRVLTMRGALAPDPSLFVSNLDGSDSRGLVFGDGSLSPDGLYMVYRDQEGRIVRLDIANNQTKTLLAQPGNGMNLRWSPDGATIGFDYFSDNYHVWVMNPDGSGMRQLTTAPGPQSLLGWSPDGSRALVVETIAGGEWMLQLVSLADGQITPIFPISGKRSYAAISPDGEWLAYSEKPFGELGQAVYVSRLDGTEQRLVAQLEHWVAFAPTWSPDGKWLMISIYDTDSYESHDAQLALVSPWTCDLLPLAGLSGEIRSWVENR